MTADRVHLFLRAVATLDAAVTADVYWAGRAALCSGPDDTAKYDEVFAAWFSGERSGWRCPPYAADLGAGRTRCRRRRRGGGQRPDRRTSPRVRRKSCGTAMSPSCRPSDRAELARLFGTLRPRVPVRRATRRRPSYRGEIDPRRTLRAQLRQVGEPARVLYRRRGTRPRRVVVLVDVSGSMRPYADSLLRLAHTLVRQAPRSVEVFTIGTRLTRVTPALRHRDPEFALRRRATSYRTGRVVPGSVRC